MNYQHGPFFRGFEARFEKRKNSTKVVNRSVVRISRPLSGAGIHVDESLWMYLSLSLPGARALTFNFPILPLLCRCFLEFLAASFPLPSLLIRGTPQRWGIIPVRSSESFMSWEDTLARVLLAPFPLRRYLHQLPSLALSLSLFSTSLPCLLLSVLVFSPMFMFYRIFFLMYNLHIF